MGRAKGFLIPFSEQGMTSVYQGSLSAPEHLHYRALAVRRRVRAPPVFRPVFSLQRSALKGVSTVTEVAESEGSPSAIWPSANEQLDGQTLRAAPEGQASSLSAFGKGCEGKEGPPPRGGPSFY